MTSQEVACIMNDLFSFFIIFLMSFKGFKAVDNFIFEMKPLLLEQWLQTMAVIHKYCYMSSERLKYPLKAD
jgi:hypothetical protein